MSQSNAHAARIRRHTRVRRRVTGTPDRPRLAVFRSNQHIYVQVIDDAAGRTLAAASDREPSLGATGSKSDRAKQVGALVAQRAKQHGITEVIFDRGGFRYAGRVKILADAAREEGLVF